MNKNKKFSFKLLVKLIKNIVYTLSIFCIFMLILYTVGNYQHFLDKTQQIILNTLSYVAIFTLFLTIPLIVENIMNLFTGKNKKESIVTIILLLLVIIIMIVTLGFSSIIEYLSEGY